MSRLSASWPTFIRPSLRTYERGKSRDDANVHATTSDLTLKIASFSKDTESTHSHRGDKSQRDTLGIFGGVFFFFPFSRRRSVGAKLRERRQIPPVVIVSFRVQRGGRHHGTSNECVFARCVNAAPSALR